MLYFINKMLLNKNSIKILFVIILWTLIAILFTVMFSGCVATSSHVKKGDVILANLAKEVSSNDRLIESAIEHVKEDAGFQLPNKNTIPFELFGGVGTLLAGAYGLMQKSQSNKNYKLAQEVAEMEPNLARERVKKV